MPSEEYIKAVETLNAEAKREEGKKWDKDKLRLDLVPPEVDEYLAPVYEHGLKYTKNNWRLGFAEGRLEAAALRHLSAYRRGEKLDEESGLPHLSHAMWNIFTMLWYDELDKKTK